MAAPLVRTSTPGVYARGSRWVAVYLEGGRQCRRSAPTFRAAREIIYALAHFAPEARLGDLDAQRLCAASSTGSVVSAETMGVGCATARLQNAVQPLRACLRHATDVGLVVGDVVAAIVLPRRRSGRAYEYDERRFLSRQQLRRLLAEIPPQWRPLFALLASTGLRISEAIGLRVMDAGLDPDAPCVHMRRASRPNA